MSESGPGTAGFIVLHGNRLEDLRDLVVELVKRQPPPPLVPEVFLVQSNGMKHWLEQALADDRQGLGICAATRLVLPSAFLWEAYRAVLGRDAVPTDLPFDKDALVWRLLRLLPQLAQTDERYAPLQRYLASDPDGRRAWQLAQQVADVLDGYQQYRADWLADWEQGGSLGSTAEQAWQPALWRELQADVGPALAATSRAAVHRQFVQALTACSGVEQRPAALPPRIIVFGVTALPLQSVEALAELGRVCEVILAVQNPCRYHWAHVVEGRKGLKALARQRQALKPPELGVADHALLAAWGKQGRDYLHQLDEFDATPERRYRLARTDLFTEDDKPTTRLARLQRSLLNLEGLPDRPEAIDPDPSVSFVQCHTAQREVEVLHDQLLAWFDEDATLQPSDIMVMVPDMSRFTSSIHAVFARFAAGEARHIPYSVADASASEQPLVQALDHLLGLPESRLTIVDWLGWFEVAALRRRFDLAEADVAGLRDWLEEAGVRWGLDGAHRIEAGLPPAMAGLDQNSWHLGLERLLLGYATGTDGSWGDRVAVAGVGGLDARRIGQLSLWLDAIRQTRAELSQRHRPAAWVGVLTALLDRFFKPADDSDARLLQRLREVLQDWLQRCDRAAFDEPLPLLIVREHWLSSIEEPTLRTRFFGGGVQFATLMPMRSIPFRRVCLLGMNDTDYPRRTAPRDFDLMAGDWRPGDRSRREDDRYLFLEALLSARERLYLSWQGRRATDNAEQPPSVVVAQLQDELARRYHPPVPAVQQPLQPFSLQYFDPRSAFNTYADDWQAAHRTSAVAAAAGPLRVAEPAPPQRITLASMARLLRQPVELYWRERLQVRLDAVEAATDTDEPFELDGLQDYQLGRELLGELQRHAPRQALERLRRSGRLPLGQQGERFAARLHDQAQRVLERAETWQLQFPTIIEPLSIELPGAPRLQADVADLRRRGSGLLQLACRPRALWQDTGRHRHPKLSSVMTEWATHVAVCAAGHELTTVVCAVDDVLVLKPMSQAEAQSQWQSWLVAWHAAWQTPLPVACRTALEWLRLEEQDAERVVDTFEGTNYVRGERQQSAYLARSFEHYTEIAAGIELWARPLYGSLLQAAKSAPSADDDE